MIIKNQQQFILDLFNLMTVNSIIFIAISLMLIASTQQCHYSCKNCTNQLYTDCIACFDSSQSNKLTTNSSTGVCTSNMVSNTNIFGIFFLLLAGVACVILMSQQIFYFALFFQTISLLYILQMSWIFGVDFILSGLNYLMIFSRISFAYKQIDTSLTDQSMFKLNTLFKTVNLVINIGMIGIINAALFILMILIPVFKAFRKKINYERVNCLPDNILDKILLGVRTFFLMIIQQTVLTIYFSLGYGKNQPANYIIAIIYFGFVSYFVVNQWINPFPYFRGKFAQLNILLSKVLIPIFMVLNPNYQFIVFIFILIFLILDIALTNKNRNKKAVNRLLIYKIFGFGTVIGLMTNYIVEIEINSQHISSAIGYLVIAILCLFLQLYGLEIFLQWRAMLQKTKVDNLQKESNKIFAQNKDVTMLSIDNKQSMTEQFELNANNLNIDQIKPEMNKHISTQIEEMDQITHKRRKDEGKKQELNSKPQLNQLMQESKIMKPKQHTISLPLNNMTQIQNIKGSLQSREPESTESNNIPVPFQQHSES